MCICVDFEATLLIPPGRWGWNQGIKLDVEMKEGFAPTMEKISHCMKALDFAWKSCKQNKNSARFNEPFSSVHFSIL